MNADAWITALKTPAAETLFLQLYGEAEKQRARYIRLAEGLRAFGAQSSPARPTEDFPETAGDVRFFSAPGRTELGGNHTDHNCGNVLAAAVQLDAVAAVAPRQDNKIFFRSTGFEEVTLDITEVGVKPEEHGTTAALIRGVAAGFFLRDIPIRGWTANADSTVLPGSGLSSSAALEVLAGKIFDGLYGGGTLPAIELAKFAQKAENLYYLKPSGLMDQAASAAGGAVAIDFGGPEPAVTRIEFDPAQAGYALCVVNTGGSHKDLTPDYGAVPAEMRSVAAFFNKPHLRAVGREVLTKTFADADQMTALRNHCGDRAVLRALHFFDENDRVDAMRTTLSALQASPETATLFQQFLRLVNESGDSSWELLQNIFSTRKPQEQSVALGLAATRLFARRLSGKQIACRVHGGGFAGTIQAYIPQTLLAEYRQTMETLFGRGAVTILKVRSLGAAEITL